MTGMENIQYVKRSILFTAYKMSKTYRIASLVILTNSEIRFSSSKYVGRELEFYAENACEELSNRVKHTRGIS